jgi:hypothetical protein
MRRSWSAGLRPSSNPPGTFFPWSSRTWPPTTACCGADPFKKKQGDKKNLRFQLEFELRSKLLALRGTWLQVHADARALEAFLVKAGTSLAYLAGRAQSAFKLKGVESAPWAESVRALKRKQLRMQLPALQALYGQVHAAVETLIQKIDAA